MCTGALTASATWCKAGVFCYDINYSSELEPPGTRGRDRAEAGAATREYDQIPQKLGRGLGSGEGEDWALDNEYYC